MQMVFVAFKSTYDVAGRHYSELPDYGWGTCAAFRYTKEEMTAFILTGGERDTGWRFILYEEHLWFREPAEEAWAEIGNYAIHQCDRLEDLVVWCGHAVEHMLTGRADFMGRGGE